MRFAGPPHLPAIKRNKVLSSSAMLLWLPLMARPYVRLEQRHGWAYKRIIRDPGDDDALVTNPILVMKIHRGARRTRR